VKKIILVLITTLIFGVLTTEKTMAQYTPSDTEINAALENLNKNPNLLNEAKSQIDNPEVMQQVNAIMQNPEIKNKIIKALNNHPDVVNQIGLDLINNPDFTKQLLMKLGKDTKSADAMAQDPELRQKMTEQIKNHPEMLNQILQNNAGK